MSWSRGCFSEMEDKTIWEARLYRLKVTGNRWQQSVQGKPVRLAWNTEGGRSSYRRGEEHFAFRVKQEVSGQHRREKTQSWRICCYLLFVQQDTSVRKVRPTGSSQVALMIRNLHVQQPLPKILMTFHLNMQLRHTALSRRSASDSPSAAEKTSKVPLCKEERSPIDAPAKLKILWTCKTCSFAPRANLNY